MKKFEKREKIEDDRRRKKKEQESAEAISGLKRGGGQIQIYDLSSTTKIYSTAETLILL